MSSMFLSSRALDSFDQYLFDVEKYPLIENAEEERALARQARIGDKEAAERLRIPRGTLYEEIKRIRRVFADQGLGDYLKE
mgnify:CR=1 FL=1